MLQLDERAAAGLDQRMKQAKAVVIGFVLGLLIFSVGREIVSAFQAKPALDVISDAVSAIGRLRWIDTTLVTGLAAVGAAYVSVRAVRDQIAADERGIQRQLDHAATSAADEKDAKLTGARAVLPITLSAICAYADSVTSILHRLLRAHRNDGDRRIPAFEISFPEPPLDAIQHLKAVIELSDANHRRVYASLVGKMQIQSARLRGYAKDAVNGETNRLDIEALALDALEVYARASLLFDYARFESEEPAGDVTLQNIGNALHGMRIFSEVYHDLCERAKTYYPSETGA